jgi:hypothetical protein
MIIPAVHEPFPGMDDAYPTLLPGRFPGANDRLGAGSLDPADQRDAGERDRTP